jgi:hypothetical protein
VVNVNDIPTGLKITPFSIKVIQFVSQPVVTGCAFDFISKAKIVPKTRVVSTFDAALF